MPVCTPTTRTGLVVDDLAGDMETALDTAFPLPDDWPDDNTDRLDWCKVLAKAIVDHIQDNARVGGVAPAPGYIVEGCIT